MDRKSLKEAGKISLRRCCQVSVLSVEDVWTRRQLSFQGHRRDAVH